jgi:hypothetical protein
MKDLDEIIDVYLLKIQSECFFDRTFQDYIKNKLARDFAYEIAMLIARLKQECMACGEWCDEENGICDFCDGGGK